MDYFSALTLKFSYFERITQLASVAKNRLLILEREEEEKRVREVRQEASELGLFDLSDERFFLWFESTGNNGRNKRVKMLVNHLHVEPKLILDLIAVKQPKTHLLLKYFK